MGVEDTSSQRATTPMDLYLPKFIDQKKGVHMSARKGGQLEARRKVPKIGRAHV